ncbi:MAG: hypothetical protein JWP35_4208 [Caulobacter sp.]|nr:hypothetical protein [Caulobacter sp.]
MAGVIHEETYLVVSGHLRKTSQPLFLADHGSGVITLEPVAQAHRFDDEATARQWIGVYLQTTQARDLVPDSLQVLRLHSKTWLENL